MLNKSFAWIAMALCFVGTAQAQVQYTSDLRMVERPRAAYPFDPDAPMRWTSVGFGPASIRVRDQVGMAFDPVTGNDVPAWNDWLSYSKLMGGGCSGCFGNGDYIGFGGSGSGRNSTAYAESSIGYLRAGAGTPASGGQSEARIFWSEDFELDPHSSFTFSVMATLIIAGDSDAPLSLSSSAVVDPALSFISLSQFDAAERVRASIGASIGNRYQGTLEGVFRYTVRPDGFMSVTVTNSSSQIMEGTLRAGAFASGYEVAAVPEPDAYLMLTCGLVAIGWVARRRQRLVASSVA